MNPVDQTTETQRPLPSLAAGSGDSASAPGSAPLPERIGRYRVVRLLGEGGFGRVFQARDEQLDRLVAIKMPHPRLVACPEDVEAYLAEARILASLDHPHIVPIHDVGRTDDGLCYVVSKFIDGSDMAARMKQAPQSFGEAAGLVAAVAEALHYAHRKGLVHRDVKPANILLDRERHPYVADFGLALRDEDFGKGTGLAGTPAYMSPEQARGEGHRVDGRSDVFSLGVVLYELLTGRRPFRGDSAAELLEQVATREARPPRQLDENIPKELERICLKALAKRAADRYSTAKDMADDLRHLLASPTTPHPDESLASRPVPAGPASPSPATPTVTPTDSRPLRIVPRGLRSFDAHDADFFLELLPGPRDRDGLPDSLRFWKTRIEEPDADSTFAVGLIYGPSGCGKSSLVKAGLLPRLSGNVIAVYVEATAEETEARLLNGLRKRCPGLPAGGLKETLAALRRGQGLPAGTKVLIVLDQFEQWLHARRDEENTELVQALRQCDGGRVQCQVMVRDDFWLAVSRFLRDVEVRLVEGENSALVDLFPIRHAEKVLAAFGRAFGALPEGEAGLEQQQFIEQAVAGLAQDGKVVSVRLALFAEMMTSRPWTPASLKAVGGAEGIGAAFLEETFSATTAPPEHRLHQKATRAVLKALLPEAGTDIKGHMRSYAELLAASGYANRPREFDDLLRILDSEVRLITPTDPEGREGEAPAEPGVRGSAGASPSPRCYQLTHDYLVPSLRDWLTRKQRETRRGRAELRLAERAALWSLKPENRFLPSWWEWLSIRLLTRKRDWTAPQRKMMRRAGRYHVTRGLALAVCLLLLGWAGWEANGRLQAARLRDRLLEATTEDVPAVVRDMAPYRGWLDESLREDLATTSDERKKLHLSLGLLPVDAGQVEYLHQRLLRGGPQEVVVIREALRPHAARLEKDLWAELEERGTDPGKPLRAACALAVFAPDDERWPKVSGNVAAGLLAENALAIGRWAEALEPVGKSLLPPLAGYLLREERPPADRGIIARIYRDYAGDNFTLLEKVLDETVGKDAPLEERLKLARRQANAAAALAAMGRWDSARPVTGAVEDPTARSYRIARLVSGGTEPQAIIDRLTVEKDPVVKQALLLAFGEIETDRLPNAHRDVLRQLYENDPDPGVHGAADWTMRRCGQKSLVTEFELANRQRKPEGRRWWVNGQGQTMMVIPRSKDGFWMVEDDKRYRRWITRDFALSSREVTVTEFLRFREKHEYEKKVAPTRECPVNNVSWYDAAAYCNWLSGKEGIAKEEYSYVGEGENIKEAPDFLKKKGYRLPTEAEWEYACRAGSRTQWSHGDAEDLLVRYAWYNINSAGRSHPAGALRPNGFGLFDMHGNLWEWCQDYYGSLEDLEEKDPLMIKIVANRAVRVRRGGSWDYGARFARSAYRYGSAPGIRSDDRGFRVASRLD